MAVGAQRSNLMTIPTDCPQRDERLGWLGDAALSAGSIALNFAAGPLLRGYAETIASALGPDGSLPDIVPHVVGGGRPGDMSWTAAFAEVVQVVWRAEGDAAWVSAMLPGLLRHVAELDARAARGLASITAPYGDWCAPPATPGGGQGPRPAGAFTASFSYIRTVDQVAALARVAGNATAAAALEARAAALRAAFAAAFRRNGTWDNDVMTARVLPLALRLPGTDAGPLVAALRARRGHFSTGILGFRHLFAALDAHGEAERALAVLLRTDYPSIGYNFANGKETATTNLWEV